MNISKELLEKAKTAKTAERVCEQSFWRKPSFLQRR